MFLMRLLTLAVVLCVSAAGATRWWMDTPVRLVQTNRRLLSHAGEVLREAHARGIRVIGRFDLSKTQKPVYDAHPEWVRPPRQWRTGGLQRSLFGVYQRRLLP